MKMVETIRHSEYKSISNGMMTFGFKKKLLVLFVHVCFTLSVNIIFSVDIPVEKIVMNLCG